MVHKTQQAMSGPDFSPNNEKGASKYTTGNQSIDVLIGEKIKRRRKQLEITLSQLADVLGITFQQVRKYERADNRVPVKALLFISQYMKTPLTYFVPQNAANENSTSRMRQAKLEAALTAMGELRKNNRVEAARLEDIENLLIRLSKLSTS